MSTWLIVGGASLLSLWIVQTVVFLVAYSSTVRKGLFEGSEPS